MSKHTIIHFNNGTDRGYLEMKCASCSSEIDLFDFDVFDWQDAAENDFHMRCKDCGHSALVVDDTPGEDA